MSRASNETHPPDPLFGRLDLMKEDPAVFAVHGPGPSVHDFITGVPGSFEKTMLSLGEALEGGKPVQARCLLNSRNLPHLKETAEILLELGVSRICLVFPGTGKEGDLPPRYSECLSRLTEVFELALNSAGGELLSLENFPPCLMKGREFLMEEFTSPGMDAAETDDLTKLPGCADCIYDFACKGFASSYASRIGTEEFVPVENRDSSARLRRMKVTLFNKRHPCLEPVRFVKRRYGGNILSEDAVIALTWRGRHLLSRLDGTRQLEKLQEEFGSEGMDFIVSLFRRKVLWLLSHPSPPLLHIRELMETIEAELDTEPSGKPAGGAFEIPLFRPWPEKYQITFA